MDSNTPKNYIHSKVVLAHGHGGSDVGVVQVVESGVYGVQAEEVHEEVGGAVVAACGVGLSA